ncbi:MAG: prolipoprotein diacylglyceryl transferase [Clostridia bacterium]|nr:prolipoprotein diacylglyceryl transferase [Clostridia bacterium]
MLPEPLFWNIHMYGVMIAVGLLGLFLILFFVGKKIGLESRFIDFMFYAGTASIVVGFFAAALFQGIYNYIEDPARGFSISRGSTFLGGLIGGATTFFAAYFIFRKRYKNRLYEIMSLLPCCVLVAHAFGRLGCFFAGCCYGVESDSAFAVQFPKLRHPVLPTQLYESIFLFVLLAVCLFLLIKFGFRHNMSVYLIAYGIFRFIIEFWRDDERGELIGSISPSQFWSIVMVVLGIGLVFVMEYLGKKRRAQLADALAEEQSA